MGGTREVDGASKRYRAKDRGHFAFCQLLTGIGMLIAWTFVFGAFADEATVTGRAARGEGIPGTFIAQAEVCGRGGCSWYGTFTTGDHSETTFESVQLRGDAGRSIQPHQAVPARDVGSRDFVHAEGGRPEWGTAISLAIVALHTGGLGVWLSAMALRGVRRARSSPAARRRAAEQRRGSALRNLTDRDRWGWTARPGSSVIKVRMARSATWALAGVGGLLLLAGMLLTFVLLWSRFNERITLADVIAAWWAPIFAVALAGAAIQTSRLLLIRPRMRVTDDEVVIRDGLLLWKSLRIPRTEIAAIHYGEPWMSQVKDDVTHLTPFREELNLAFQMRNDLCLPARRLRFGNWFWALLSLKDTKLQTSMPQRGRPIRNLCLRVKEPRRVAADLDRWLGEDAPLPPPQFTPVDHAHYGTVRTHTGTGGTRLKIKGELPQPVLAEIKNEGTGTLHAWLRRSEFGAGTPVAVCRPDAPPATIVLHDRLISDKALTKRFLHVESQGRWTVTIGGPERAREFTGSARGGGPDVLAYQGPPGIAVLTCPSGQRHQVHLYGPNLDALPGCDPVAHTTPPGDEPSPSRSTFAVPAQALIQVETGSDWRIDVTPLEHADVDAPAPARAVPPTGHVRPFEHSIAGDRAAVVRYLGPPGRVLFRSGDAFGLLHLGPSLAPVRTLALPDGDAEIRLRSHALLQVTGGNGTWSLDYAADQVPGSASSMTVPRSSVMKAIR